MCIRDRVGTFKKIYEENEGRPFPQDPRDQLIEAVKAVFRSWDNPRANVYRKMNEIPYECCLLYTSMEVMKEIMLTSGSSVVGSECSQSLHC